MKKRTRNTRIYFITILLLAFGFILAAYAKLEISPDEWEVPAAAKNMKNPTDPKDGDGLFTGKSLYVKNCKSCHGKSGRGDGPSAKELKTFSGDFTSSEFHAQTDGEIFYKIREGRGDMPSFKKIVTEDENIWFIVNYIRTFNE